MRQMLLITLMALLFGAAGIWLVQQDQGYLLISLGTTSVEMSFWAGAIIYFVSCGILVWLLLVVRWLLDAGGIGRWWRLRRSSRHSSKTARGLLLFLGDDWQASSQILSQSAANSSMPQVNLLFAARAAAKNKQFDRSRQLLEQLKTAHPNVAVRADLCLAEVLIEDLKLEEALAILLSLDQDHKMVLRLLSNIYRLQSDWSALCALLPAVKKQRALGEQSLRELQIESHCGLLQSFTNKGLAGASNAKILGEIWSDVPKNLRQVPEIVAAYTDALAATDTTDKGLAILSKALKYQWHGELIKRFGSLEAKDSEKQLALGEKWLKEHAEDPRLLMALGRICQRMGFLGKARDYMIATIAIQPTAQAYFEFAALLSLIGDSRASAKMYRQGLEFVVESSA